MPTVALLRSSMPILPARAAANSLRAAWFSMLAGLASESASTLPEASMMVARAPAAWPSWVAISAMGRDLSVSTRWANISVFCCRLRSISLRTEASHALPNIRSMMRAVAAMTMRKTASSLKKMRFFICRRYILSSFGDLEAIAGAAHGFEIARILRVGLDFFANTAHVDVDRARRDIRSVAPDGVKQVVAGEYASAVAGEVIEQAELGGRGGNECSADGEGHRGGIDFDFADFDRARRKRALEAAHDGFDAGDQLARAEGLGDVVVGTEFEAEDAVGFATFRGEKNYRHRGEGGSLANGAADLEAVFAGDHDIEQEKRGALPFGVGEHVGSGGIDAHGEALVLKMMANEAGNVGIVFDDEDAGFHREYCIERRSEYLVPSSETRMDIHQAFMLGGRRGGAMRGYHSQDWYPVWYDHIYEPNRDGAQDNGGGSS